MASGSFTFSTSNKYITGKIVWSSTSDVASNSSTVTATLSYMKSSSSTASTSGTYNGNITIHGNQKDFSKRITLYANNSWVTIGSHTVTVGHNADGSKSITMSASGGCSGTSFDSSFGSKTVALDTIPRKSSASLSTTDPHFGNEITVNITRAATSFTHTVQQDFYLGYWTNIATGVGTSCKWTIPWDYMNRIPNHNSGAARIRVITYSGGTYIGEVILNFNIHVPQSVVPTVTSLTASPVGVDVGGFVHGKHSVRATMAGNWNGGANYHSVTINIAGTTYNGTDVTSGILYNSGNKTIETTMRDTRGRTATRSIVINYWGYWNPGASIWVARCDENGTPNDIDGTYLKITVSASSCNVGQVNRNTTTCKVQWRHIGGEWADYYTISSTIDGDHYRFSDTRTLAGWDINRAYEVRVLITDKWTTSMANSSVNTGFTTMDIKSGGKGIAFGKVSERDAFECNMDVLVKHDYLVGHCPRYTSNGSDFNGLTGIGDYFNPSNSTCTNMVNAPEKIAFYLEVRRLNGMIHQRFTVYNGDRVYIRYYADWSNTWDNWRTHEAHGQVSDFNEKLDVKVIDQTYEDVFDRLNPVSFRYNERYSDNKIHLGFIAQDVENVLTKPLSEEPFAGVIVDKYVDMDTLEEKTSYKIAYNEFIALNTHMIKKLQVKNDILQNQYNSLTNELNLIKKELSDLKNESST